MEYVISHKSALEYWRLYGADDVAPRKSSKGDIDPPRSVSKHKRQNITLPESLPEVGKVSMEDSLGLSMPIDIMLSNPNARRNSQTTKQHVFVEAIPPSSLVQIKDGIAVSSPEFCFLQMASELSLIKLIELAFELCGSYSLPTVAAEHSQSQQQTRGFSIRKPLTDTKRLKTFIAQLSGVNGIKKARRALRYVAGGSASPMETKLTMFLTLPLALGGYGLPMPELNSRIIPVRAAKRTASRAYYLCDLFWPDYDLAVEYDSDLYHTGSERIASDSKKRNTLTSLGIVIITVTTQQIHSSTETEKIARLVAGNMEKRLRISKPDFIDAHRTLRKLLY